jgi:hypothetical protein
MAIDLIAVRDGDVQYRATLERPCDAFPKRVIGVQLTVEYFPSGKNGYTYDRWVVRGSLEAATFGARSVLTLSAPDEASAVAFARTWLEMADGLIASRGAQ